MLTQTDHNHTQFIRASLAALVASMPEGCVVFNQEGGLVCMNRSAVEMLGCGEDCAQVLARVRELIGLDPGQVSAPIRHEHRMNGRLFRITCAPMHEGTERVGSAVFLQDIGVLDQVDELTSDFVSIASHELRNPLAALKNALQILHTAVPDGDPAVFERFLTIATRNAERIANLITQYLDISRIEAGTAPCSFEKVQLAAVVENILPEIQAQARAAHLQLHTALPDDLPPVYADPQYLEQIFFNLVGNAVKFTPPGGTITVAAQPVADTTGEPSEAPAMIAVTVADTGIGIPADKRALIFKKFYRLPRDGGQAPAGVGLGLAIVERLVQLHGGKITVEDNQPSGSRFCFTLPVYGQDRRDLDVRRIFDREFHRARSGQEHLALFVIMLEQDSGDEAGIRRVLQASLHRAKDIVVQHREGKLFVVFCETGAEGARAICTRLQERIAEYVRQHQLPHGYGIGYAVYPDDAATQRDLYRLAASRAQEDAHEKKKDFNR